MSQSNTNIVQARFLADIVVLQQTTAPVSLEIGAVINGTVENGVITVSKAPGAILSRVISIADSLGVLYSLVQGGIRLDFRAANELRREEFFD